MIDLPPPLAALVVGRDATRVEAGEAGADVFRLDGAEPLYLKHGAGRAARDVADEGARLLWAAGRLPVPAVRQLVATPDDAWLLTTALPGRTGDELIEDDPAHLDAVIDGAAALLRRLHALPVDACPFDAGTAVRLAAARANIDAGLVDEEDFADDHAGWSAEQVWAELERLGGFEVERVVTHGDFSLGNILFEDGRASGLIDVGRMGVADRYVDFAILWENLAEFGAAAQRRFLNACGIDAVDARRLEFFRCLDELF